MQFSSLAPVALIAGIFGSGPFLSDPCPTPRADEPVAQREFVIEAGTHDLRALLDRSAKWAGRHRSLVASVLGVCLLALMGTAAERGLWGSPGL